MSTSRPTRSDGTKPPPETVDPSDATLAPPTSFLPGPEWDDPTVTYARISDSAVARLPSDLSQSSIVSALHDSGETPKYEIGDEVGRGGMGSVHKVMDFDLRRVVAMKVLPANKLSEATLQKFVEEAQITAQLTHPNILPVHDVGVNLRGELYFTMKYVASGETLRDVIKRLKDGDPETHDRHSMDRRVALGQKLCNALQFAHERGVVHRDIKPSNIMIDEQGEVYLVDWGVAKLVGLLTEGDPDAEADISDPLRLEYAVGTPAYMAPEGLDGTEVDARADVYGMCAVLYELLSLHHYLGEEEYESTMALLDAVATRVPASAESHYGAVNGRVPRVLSRICAQGLAKDPDLRFQTAFELEAALQGWQEGCGPVICPGTALQRGMNGWSRWIDRHPVLIPAVSYTVLGLLVISYIYLMVRVVG